MKDVVRSKVDDCENRWLLVFSEYAEIDVSDAWPGNRNPVLYTDLEEFGIKLDELQLHPMPEQEPVAGRKITPLTMAEAKAGLAQTFGVEPSDVEITIRG